MASSLSNKVSNNPPLASKHDVYKIVSSFSKKLEIFCSNSLCIDWVPHINLTELRPNPYFSKASLAYLIKSWLLDKPK